MLAPSMRQLDFASRNGRTISGLIAVADGEEAVQKLDERLAVRSAIGIGNVDYLFFRRFSDSRSSQVVAYIVDNASGRLDESALAELHKRVWLHGDVPLIYVAWPTRVDVLSCARGPDFWHDGVCEYSPAATIGEAIGDATLISKALQSQYSAWRLLDGTFWENPANAPLAMSSERAHEKLIEAVVEADVALEGEDNPLLRRLLLLTVLIKYLEDRRVFPTGWFGGFCRGSKSFFDVLSNGEPAEVIRLLSNLERRFNGDIFSLPPGASSQLTDGVLRHFATLVEARTIRRQRYLWEQFSFEHIPVEIISHLYQRFVKGGHGTVYTPPFLASLLLDYAMPYEALRGDERVLDPACGSGVFLVGAFRRLINVHVAQGGWRAPSVQSLKTVLKRSIFGIELDAGAIDLASFSLALAICDALKPDVIWNALKFDPLRGENLLEADFFSEVKKATSDDSCILARKFDVIVGNPPFESELTPDGISLNRQSQGSRGTLPDKQAAYLFLEQSIQQLRESGRLCLIQPSGILYNRNAYSFRRTIIESARIEMVLDFTSLRSLFEAADTKAAAILISGSDPTENHTISHVTFRRTFGTLERIAFEIDHYDWHRVPQREAVEDAYVWRVNLLGGGRLVGLSRRFREMRSLSEFVEQEGLTYGEGFTAGSGGSGKHSFLTGMTLLPSTALTDDGIDSTQLTTLTATDFERERSQDIYKPPLILIRKNERLQMAYWSDGPLAYAIRIVGIGVGSSKASVLEEMYNRLKSQHDTYRLACVLHGTESFVAKATAIRKQDIDALPYPEEAEDLRLSYWERALERDTLDYFCDYVRLGQNSTLLKNAADGNAMRSYAALVCRLLGSVYDNIVSEEPIFLDGLICQGFYFGEPATKNGDMKGRLAELRKLIYHKHHDSLRTVRMLRFYIDNMMLIIKPDRLRFWIPSTAIQDADETIVALRDQGY